MKARIGLRGWTTIRELLLGPDGKPLPADGKILYSDHNIITTFGKTRGAQLLGGLSANYINQMAIGDEGAPSGSPSTPFIPTLTDTGLAHELLRTSTVNPVIVGTNQLKFTAIFLTSPPLSFAGSLHAINEVGLFCVDDVQPGTPRMFARNTFPSIPFDPSDRDGVIVTWTITVP